MQGKCGEEQALRGLLDEGCGSLCRAMHGKQTGTPIDLELLVSIPLPAVQRDDVSGSLALVLIPSGDRHWGYNLARPPLPISLAAISASVAVGEVIAASAKFLEDERLQLQTHIRPGTCMMGAAHAGIGTGARIDREVTDWRLNTDRRGQPVILKPDFFSMCL